MTATFGCPSDARTLRLRAAGAASAFTSLAGKLLIFLELSFQFGEQFQRVERRHPIDVDRGELFAERIVVGGGGRLKQRQLPLRIRRRAAHRRPAAARELVALERAEDLARAIDHGLRQAREPRHLDPVAAIGAAGNDLAQEDDLVLPRSEEHTSELQSLAYLVFR